MSDTIEWLETIGRSAALRRAPAGELVHALEGTDASDALRAAAACGDSSRLFTELGHKPMKVNHDTHTGGHEGDEPDHDHDHGKDEPRHPPSGPDRDGPKDH